MAIARRPFLSFSGVNGLSGRSLDAIGAGRSPRRSDRSGEEPRSKIRETDDFQQRRRDPAGTFVCGASTNGLIGTHLIAACHDYGIPEVRSAQLLAVMGIFDIIGTTAVGLAHRSLS